MDTKELVPMTCHTGDNSENGTCDMYENESEGNESCDIIEEKRRRKHDSVGLCRLKKAASHDQLIAVLSEGCKENVLSFDYLLGEGLPKAEDCRGSECVNAPFLNPDSPIAKKMLRNPLKVLRKRRRALITARSKCFRDHGDETKTHEMSLFSDDNEAAKAHVVHLHSAKMKGLKSLLCAEKLNASAIQLQLTAQSQTARGSALKTTSESGASTSLTASVSSQGGHDESVAGSGRPKRARRE